MKKLKWQDLSLKDKALLFNNWSLVILLSNTLQIFGTILYILRYFVPLFYSEFFIGFGCMLCWVSLTRYLEHTKEFSFLSRTISYAFPDVMRHLINVLPYYIGFGLLGVSIFWMSYRFRYPNVAIFNLFALSVGDEISNTFNDIT